MKKIVIPIIFTLVGASFTTYSFLDTFIIVKNAKSVDLDHNSTFSFNDNPVSKSSSSSKPSSTDSSNSSASSSSSSSQTSNISNTEYYENLTNEQIDALFTAEKVFREREHYSDPDIYIDITTHRDEADTTTYYVADIRLKSLGYMKTALAKDTYGMHIKERTSDICKRKKGILAIDGDTYGEQEGGFVVRNGIALRDSKNLDRMRGTTKKAEDLIIYGDGTFSIIDEKYTDLTIYEKDNPNVKIKPFDIKDSDGNIIGNNNNVWQVFSFGPALIKNSEVAVEANEEVGTAMSGNRNQRCAIGIVAPKHYVFVVSDGRSSESAGLSLRTLGEIMKDLHCQCAYNLDGGGSATMYLDDGTGNANGLAHLVNKPTQDLSGGYNPGQGGATIGQREVSDIVYIGKDQD